MGRRSSDHIATHSSIALLQERFRRLQRAKELREKRELLRQFCQSPGLNPTEFSEPPRSFFQSDLILTHSPPLPGSLSSQPDLHNKHSDLQLIETPILVNLWPPEKVYQASKSFDDSDVDTSLHLWGKKIYNVCLLCPHLLLCFQFFYLFWGCRNEKKMWVK